MNNKFVYILCEFDCGDCNCLVFNDRDDAMDALKAYHLSEEEISDVDHGFIITLSSGSSLVLKCSEIK